MEFSRSEGEGGAAQRWIDHNLPVCPMCREESLWKTATGVEQQALTRWYFQCPNCMVVMSTIPEDPVAAVVEAEAFAKVPIQVELRVESVQRKQDEDFVGEEFPLYELQQWAEETED